MTRAREYQASLAIVTSPRNTSCVFCKIVDGLAPAAIVHDDDACLAFLDVSPLFLGHVLVVPKIHAVTLADLDASAIGPLFERVRRISVAVEKALGAGGTFVAMNQKVSQSVPHLHVHVVPRVKGDGLRGFFWPRKRYAGEEEMAKTREAIANELTAAANSD